MRRTNEGRLKCNTCRVDQRIAFGGIIVPDVDCPECGGRMDYHGA